MSAPFYKLPLMTALFLVAVFAPALAVAQPVSCETLLRAALAHDPRVEQGILDSVSANSVKPENISKLASDVFQLTLADGNSVVLRTASASANPAFEDFASRLVRQAPGLGTPLVRKLTGAELRPYLTLLRKAGFTSGVKMNESTDAAPLATLAVFFPMTLGKRYVADTVGMELRAELQDLLEGYVGFGNAEEASHAWKNSDPDARFAVAEDVSSLLPELAPGKVAPSTLLRLAESRGKENLARALEPLGQLGWRRLAKPVREQLAAYWAMYTALGIPDFHPKNWLARSGADGDLVLAIDLALKSADFSRGDGELELVNHQSPHDGSRISSEMYRELLSGISPEMLTFLKGLTRAGLAKLAAEAGFAITEPQLSGVLARIQAMLAHR